MFETQITTTAAQAPNQVSHQLWQASFGKHSSWAVDMKMCRTPAPHIEPFHSSGWERSILLMEQNQLLLGSDRCVLQHPLQLEEIIYTKGVEASGTCCSVINLMRCSILEYIHARANTCLTPDLNVQIAVHSGNLKQDGFSQPR